MKTEHTPGPWETVKYKNSGLDVDDCWHIYTQPDLSKMYTTIGSINSKHNAKLVAAAPELLEALEKCITYIPAFIKIGGEPFENEHGREVYDKANAAIKKAKGL